LSPQPGPSGLQNIVISDDDESLTHVLLKHWDSMFRLFLQRGENVCILTVITGLIWNFVVM
jgi:hypothetical protein